LEILNYDNNKLIEICINSSNFLDKMLYRKYIYVIPQK